MIPAPTGSRQLGLTIAFVMQPLNEARVGKSGSRVALRSSEKLNCLIKGVGTELSRGVPCLTAVCSALAKKKV